MISLEKWARIRSLAKEGYGKKAIARMLGISKNTVRRVLASDEPPQYVRQKPVETKVAPFKEQVKHMYLEQKLIGIRIHNELVKLGYDGSLTILYRYQLKIKQEKHP